MVVDLHPFPCSLRRNPRLEAGPACRPHSRQIDKTASSWVRWCPGRFVMYLSPPRSEPVLIATPRRPVSSGGHEDPLNGAHARRAAQVRAQQNLMMSAMNRNHQPLRRSTIRNKVLDPWHGPLGSNPCADQRSSQPANLLSRPDRDVNDRTPLPIQSRAWPPASRTHQTGSGQFS